MSRYVISLGGNALGNHPAEQKELLKNVTNAIIKLIKAGHDIVIVHGNGPQVGMINLAFDHPSVPDMPFPECGAMSQGYIGFHIQNALLNKMKKEGINRPVTTLITQVLVEKNDEAFLHPTKPIGSFYTLEVAKKLEQEKGYHIVEDSGRGYRRVIASPKPKDIIEKESIKTLLDKGHIVIASGGGGIPVIEVDSEIIGIDAVIDKDYASAKMAEIIGADELIILTAVDYVYINFNQENQQALKHIQVSDLDQYVKENQFKKGSMLPKIEAAIGFVKHTKKAATIASLNNAELAFDKKAGTTIHP